MTNPGVGLFGVNMGVCAGPEGAVRAAVLAEELGYDSVWVGEHVVIASPRAEPSPLDPDYPILDPFVALSLVAGRTRRVGLATGIINLPQRNPVVLAKELASLDVVSGGRLVFGMGVGYVEPEMAAVGVPMAGRGVRAEEYLRAMRVLWEDRTPAFQGEYVRFEGVDAYPRPGRGSIPVVVAGHSRAALRRAVRVGDGWYGFLLDRRATAEHIEGLRHEAGVLGRELDGFSITVSPTERLDPEVVRDYGALGVTRLALVPRRGFWRSSGYSLEALEDFIRDNAPERIGAAAMEDPI